MHQHTINTIKGQKLVTLLEVLCSREKGSEAEQQPILQELKESTNTSCTFVTSKIKYYYNNWKNITNDRLILDIVKYGLRIDFKNKPHLVNVPKNFYNAQEKHIIDLETNKLLKKREPLPNVKRNRMTLLFSGGKRRMAHFELF